MAPTTEGALINYKDISDKNIVMLDTPGFKPTPPQTTLIQAGSFFADSEKNNMAHAQHEQSSLVSPKPCTLKSQSRIKIQRFVFKGVAVVKQSCNSFSYQDIPQLWAMNRNWKLNSVADFWTPLFSNGSFINLAFRIRGWHLQVLQPA